MNVFAKKKACYKCGIERPKDGGGAAAGNPEAAVLNMKAEDELDAMEEEEEEEEEEEGNDEKEEEGEEEDEEDGEAKPAKQPSKAAAVAKKGKAAAPAAPTKDPSVPESVTQVRARTLRVFGVADSTSEKQLFKRLRKAGAVEKIEFIERTSAGAFGRGPRALLAVLKRNIYPNTSARPHSLY